jgi:hypothetical protein
VAWVWEAPHGVLRDEIPISMVGSIGVARKRTTTVPPDGTREMMSAVVCGRMIKRLASVLMILGCTASAPTVIVSTSGTFVSNGSRDILDLRLDRVVLSGVSMEQALWRLAKGISSSTDGKIEFALTIENSRDMTYRVPLKDPRVDLDVSDTTLGNVLDQLCRQSGWSYKKAPIGIVFTDSDMYSEAHGALLRDDQSLGNEIVAALQKYRAEKGKYPDRLSELVPDYIAEIKSPRYGAKKWSYNNRPDRDTFSLFILGAKPQPGLKPAEDSYWYNPLRREWSPAEQR